jgi:DNA-binding IclR family transcriptional regulator
MTETLASPSLRKDKSTPAPAVKNAIAILEFLATDRAEAGLSLIARATGMNKSTCFNVLTALLDGQMIVKDAQHATYRLGPRLIEFGTASRRNFSGRSVYHQVLQPIADQSGFGCIVGQPLGDLSGIVVIDSILPGDVSKGTVTPPIGFRYAITTPAMGRAVMAYLGDEDACDTLRRLGLDIPGGKEKFCAQLAVIRERGFSISHEEYKSGINAVAACIRGRHNEVASIACLVGRAAEFAPDALMYFGGELVRAARSIEELSVKPVD